MHRLSFIFLFPLSLTISAEQFEVYKSPACGCCQKWVDAIEGQGHDVIIHHADNLHKIKFDSGIPVELGACHTAFVNGYIIEGHVPIEAINELLENNPDIKGIAVPGMPGESLGMEQGGQAQPYVVYGFDNESEFFPVSSYIGTSKIE